MRLLNFKKYPGDFCFQSLLQSADYRRDAAVNLLTFASNNRSRRRWNHQQLFDFCFASGKPLMHQTRFSKTPLPKRADSRLFNRTSSVPEAIACSNILRRKPRYLSGGSDGNDSIACAKPNRAIPSSRKECVF